MPDGQSEIDAALELLAEACASDLTRSAYERAWAAALPQVRPETVSAPAAASLEPKRAEIRYLYERAAVKRFAAALTEMQPPPETSVRNAVIALHNAMTIDIAAWQNLSVVELEAATSDRDAFISAADMDAFYRLTWPRMCCIVGATTKVVNGIVRDKTIGGTGFLVGPDLVMTNSHVIAALLDEGGAARPGTDKDFALFFDHNINRQIAVHTADIPGTLRVEPASAWLAAHCPRSVPGGDADKLLDYAVIRLKDRMGNAAANRHFGVRRGWIKVPRPGEAEELKTDHRVAIPQHPGGWSVRLDIGRVAGGAPGVPSRVWYNVYTAPGSSGSPVIGTGGKLVALHEGSKSRGAGQRADPNQGIRITAFNRDRPAVFDEPDDPPNIEARWCVRGTGASRHPLIGRRRFIDWVHASRNGETPTVPPICTVHGPEKSGKSFTADILGALVEGTGDDLVVFRSSTAADAATPLRTYVLPDRPDLLLLALADAIGLATDNLPKAPPELDQARTELGPGVVDDLKLNAWASEDLPNWLATELGKVLGNKPGVLLWTVFDIKPNSPFGPPIRDFLAKWIAPVDKSHPFARCRWVFIGYKPDFSVATADDRLDPQTEPAPDDLGQFLAAAYGAMRGIQPPEMLAVFTSVLEVARPDPGKLWPLLTAFGDGLLKALRAEAELADGT